MHIPLYDDTPETVRAAFANRTMLSLPEVAKLLEMDRRTLRNQIVNGEITARLKGAGQTRRRWAFTITDVAKYLHGTNTSDVRRSFHGLAAALARGPLKLGTMNVRLARPRRKAKKADGLRKQKS